MHRYIVTVTEHKQFVLVKSLPLLRAEKKCIGYIVQLLRQQKYCCSYVVTLTEAEQKCIGYVVTVTEVATAMGAESTERPPI